MLMEIFAVVENCAVSYKAWKRDSINALMSCNKTIGKIFP
jgi:hypothetical protein